MVPVVVARVSASKSKLIKSMQLQFALNDHFASREVCLFLFVVVVTLIEHECRLSLDSDDELVDNYRIV